MTTFFGGRSSRKRRSLGSGWLFSGAGLGAALMYLFDPSDGRRRRGMARDKLNQLVRQAQDRLQSASRDVSGRVKGMRAEAEAAAQQEQVSDDMLEQHVRAKLGQITAHPASIEVNVENGRVELSGTVMPNDHVPIVTAVESIPGVKAVDDDLNDYEQPGTSPGLQG
jgi:osmotically-inducible protein OsmY